MSKRSNHAGVYSISLCALLLSMMLIVGYVESMIPLNVGIPGIKLGMSNSVLIFAVYMLDIPTAFMLMSAALVLLMTSNVKSKPCISGPLQVN